MPKTTVHAAVTTGGGENVVTEFPPTNTTTVHAVTTVRAGDAQTVTVRPVE